MLLMLEVHVRIKEETLQKLLKTTIWLWKKIKKDLLPLMVIESTNSDT